MLRSAKFGQVFRACSKSFVAQVAEIVEVGECDDSAAAQKHSVLLIRLKYVSSNLYITIT